MKNFENLFDKETITNICNLVENKMYILNNIKDFHDKDKLLANAVEDFESNLSDDLKNKFKNIMRLNYQIEDYYFTLAYFLGSKF